VPPLAAPKVALQQMASLTLLQRSGQVGLCKSERRSVLIQPYKCVELLQAGHPL
jgi:hypothetical protein